MTNKNKKRRPSGYRDPLPAAAEATSGRPQRRGLLDSIFAPRYGAETGMPKTRTSFARGIVTVLASPVLLVGGMLVTFGLWLASILAGYQGPFAGFVSALAVPPIGTSFDATLATTIFGLRTGLYVIFVFVVARAVLLALATGVIVDTIELGSASRWSALRGLRALPVTMAVGVTGFMILTLASILGPLLGAGAGYLIQVAALIAGVYLFAAAPTIAVTERRGIQGSLSRSFRAARMPGSGNLGVAALYVIAVLAALVAPGKPGHEIGVNPSVGAWVLVLGMNLVHLAAQATFAYRYLSVAPQVPEGPVRRGSAPRR